jgi:hypothetical protein
MATPGTDDALALRYSLSCTIPPLRAVAVAHVAAELRANRGALRPTATRLGIALSTLQGYLAASPELREVRAEAKRGDGTTGRGNRPARPE